MTLFIKGKVPDYGAKAVEKTPSGEKTSTSKE